LVSEARARARAIAVHDTALDGVERRKVMKTMQLADRRVGQTRPRVKRLVAGVAATVAIAVPGTAAAQPQIQDGLVNVAIGDVTILEDVNVGVAAVVAANVCGVNVGPVAVLGRAVDRSGNDVTVCTTPTGPVTIEQN
jgi:hypothetical protein